MKSSSVIGTSTVPSKSSLIFFKMALSSDNFDEPFIKSDEELEDSVFADADSLHRNICAGPLPAIRNRKQKLRSRLRDGTVVASSSNGAAPPSTCTLPPRPLYHDKCTSRRRRRATAARCLVRTPQLTALSQYTPAATAMSIAVISEDWLAGCMVMRAPRVDRTSSG
jgi:hypothetical protein